jgi:signal peptidase I
MAVTDAELEQMQRDIKRIKAILQIDAAPATNAGISEPGLQTITNGQVVTIPMEPIGQPVAATQTEPIGQVVAIAPTEATDQAVATAVCEAETRQTLAALRGAKRRRLRSCIVGFFFYLFLAVLLLCVYTFAGTGSGPPRHILGWTAMTVLTRSMQSEIPQDSLIVTYHCDPAQLKVGDNATYLKNEIVTVTHKITDIETGSDGKRLFTFQGTDNPAPDEDKVPEGSFVGKVMFHNLSLGKAVKFVKLHLLISCVMTALVFAFFIFLVKFLKKDEPEDTKPKSTT